MRKRQICDSCPISFCLALVLTSLISSFFLPFLFFFFFFVCSKASALSQVLADATTLRELLTAYPDTADIKRVMRHVLRLWKQVFNNTPKDMYEQIIEITGGVHPVFLSDLAQGTQSRTVAAILVG